LGNLGPIERLQQIFCPEKVGTIVANLLRPSMKPLVGRLVITSKCTARYTVHVNSKIQIFPPSFKYKGPAKSTPVTSKTKASPSLSPGNGIGSFFNSLRYMSSTLYTFCYHSLHHFPSPMNTEALAQIIEYDLKHPHAKFTNAFL